MYLLSADGCFCLLVLAGPHWRGRVGLEADPRRRFPLSEVSNAIVGTRTVGVDRTRNVFSQLSFVFFFTFFFRLYSIRVRILVHVFFFFFVFCTRYLLLGLLLCYLIPSF